MGGGDRMGLLECASGASVWRGYDYYKEKKVVALEEIEANIFSAKMSGNSGEPYSVEFHIDHPRKSKCNCPHADGKRIICKHNVAAYFTAIPDEAEKFYAEAMAYQEEEEKRQEEKTELEAQLAVEAKRERVISTQEVTHSCPCSRRAISMFPLTAAL